MTLAELNMVPRYRAEDELIQVAARGPGFAALRGAGLLVTSTGFCVRLVKYGGVWMKLTGGRRSMHIRKLARRLPARGRPRNNQACGGRALA
jgi:hypothetical protein